MKTHWSAKIFYMIYKLQKQKSELSLEGQECTLSISSFLDEF